MHDDFFNFNNMIFFHVGQASVYERRARAAHAIIVCGPSHNKIHRNKMECGSGTRRFGHPQWSLEHPRRDEELRGNVNEAADGIVVSAFEPCMRD